MRLIVVIALVALALMVSIPALADGINVIDLVKENGLVAGLIIVAVLFTFRYIPNEKLYGFVRGSFNKLGVAMTLGLSKWSWSKTVWNKYVEPWFIDLISNTVLAAIDGLVAGLKSDNE